jgi:transposase
MKEIRHFGAEITEWRRFRALELHERGWLEVDIAEALDVNKGTVSRWLAAARAAGPEALLSHPTVGCPAKLTAAQVRSIPEFLCHGAEAYGFRGDVWTCARIAQVIEWEFGVSYHKDHVSRLMKALGWTPQIPITRAVQRDEPAIEHWRVAVWPELRRQAMRERRTLVFIDESGFYLLPGVVKTYGPKGKTPVIDKWSSRDHLSVMAGFTLAGKVYTLVRSEALTSEHSVAFLQHLLRQTGKRLLVIWDGSPIHRWGAVQEYLAGGGAKRIHVEALPGYAPELSPLDQGGWHHLKHVEMRNLSCMDLEELHLELHLAIGRLRQKPRLIQQFFTDAGLSE